MRSPKKSGGGTTGSLNRDRGGVGLRAATGKMADSVEALKQRQLSRRLVEEARDAKRKAIWDKLDEAKKRAEHKTQRIKSFEPKKDKVEEDLDDFDF